MSNKYVILHLELGVLAIGTERSYGMDAKFFAEGIEFASTALETDEYVVLGYYDELDHEYDLD